jgi:hypothetical protein
MSSSCACGGTCTSAALSTPTEQLTEQLIDEPRSIATLLIGQRGLRNRYDDFLQALQRNDRPAVIVAINDFQQQLERWTDAEEKSLLPALIRNGVAGRDARRELLLEYVQIRELTRYLVRQIGEGIRSDDLSGFAQNLDRRLRAHEGEMERVYYPAAVPILTPDDWAALLSARPDP